MKVSSPIFIVSRFRSGSSFLWNVFRQDPQYRCYYEPLHDNLVEAVETNLPAMDSHRGIESYWTEYQPVLKDLPAVHQSLFGVTDLYLAPDDARPDLAAFIQFLIQSAAAEKCTCVIKCNRLDFRLGWLRKNFPEARIISVERNARDQWISSVRPHKPELWDRLEENRGYDLPIWVASLASIWPFLLSGPPRPAYYYSYLIWKLSTLFGRRFAQLQLDFDQDVAIDPTAFKQKMAQFFAADFFEQPAVKAIIQPPHPGIWRRFRTAEWFQEIERLAEQTLSEAGVYAEAFWQAPGKACAPVRPRELRRALDLATHTFSRHRGELLVHSQQLHHSVTVAKDYAKSLKEAHEKASKALSNADHARTDAVNRLRLLQAVYDSLKQAHELSLASQNKILEEFQFTTKELHQIITLKEEQLKQLTRNLLPGQAALLLAGQPLSQISPEEIAQLRAAEGRLREEIRDSENRFRQIEAQLAEASRAASTLKEQLSENQLLLRSAESELNSSRELRRHATALECAAAESWAQIREAKAQAREAQVRAEELAAAQASLKASFADLEFRAGREVRDLERQVEGSRERIGALEHETTATRRTLVDAESRLAQLHRVLATLETKSLEDGAELDSLRKGLAEKETFLEEVRRALEGAQATIASKSAEISALQSVVEQENRLAQQVTRERAELLERLHAETRGRNADKRAYDERASLLIAQSHTLLEQKADGEAARQREVAELRGQLGRTESALQLAQARLASLQGSWAAGLIRHLAPQAFSQTEDDKP